MSQVTFGRRGQTSSPARPVVERTASPLMPGAAPAFDAAPVAHAGKPPQWAQVTPKQNAVMMLICAAFFSAMLFFQAPNLLTDLRHSGSYRPDFSLRTAKGDCSGYLFVLRTCSVRLRELNGREHSVRFMLMFASTEGRRILPMRSPTDPDAVSAGFALDQIGNRLMSFAGLSLLLLGGIAIGALRLVQGRYKGGPAAAPWETQAEAG